GVERNFSIPLTAGSISYFELTVNESGPYLAGVPITLDVTAKDAFDNGVINDSTIVCQAINSTGAEFSQSSYTFSDSVHTISLTDTVVEIINVQVQLQNDASKNGTSTTIEIDPNVLAELRIRSEAGNSGTELSNVAIPLTSDENLILYSAGYDEYGNYREDVVATHWYSEATSTFLPTIDEQGSSLVFTPTQAGTGQLIAEIEGSPSIRDDSTGTITVGNGVLAEIRIQSDATDDGPLVTTLDLSAGQTSTMYSVGYDADGNFLDLTFSDWVINNEDIGDLDNYNDQHTVVFTADLAGTGVISATADGTSITDETGLITVSVGSANYIVIRTGANNGGSSLSGVAHPMTTDEELTLYAAHYDAQNNYISDQSVAWTSGLTGVPAGPSASITFSPTISPEVGTISTASGSLTNDATGNITVSDGALHHLVIQDANDGSGLEIDTMIFRAGQDTTMYVAGYDTENNFVDLYSSDWTQTGSDLGSFSLANPSDNNTYTAETVGSTVIRADEDGGSLFDITSSISINPGNPASLVKYSEVDSQSAAAGSTLPKDMKVRVLDTYNNPVPNVTVNFSPLGGGTVTPPTNQTDEYGFAYSQWTLHATDDPDSLRVYVENVDTIQYYATVSAGSADSLFWVVANTDSGQVDTDISTAFTVMVQDSLDNPVTGAEVSFYFNSVPNGSSNHSLSQYNATTVNGLASTTIHLGSKIGNYIVRASANTNPAFVEFTAVAD
ncbi:MAG: Ig-like domain-containing protein, partial [Calditrichia bacterium]|nr:Ig-like domain-containing protein [Calditrichia bacterium]